MCCFIFIKSEKGVLGFQTEDSQIDTNRYT